MCAPKFRKIESYKFRICELKSKQSCVRAFLVQNQKFVKALRFLPFTKVTESLLIGFLIYEAE